MIKESDIFMYMVKSLLDRQDVPAHILHGHNIGHSGYAVCRADSCLTEQDHRKAAVAALRAGFIPVPVCPRFDRLTVDLDYWKAALSIQAVREHWQRHPHDEVGFLLERANNANNIEDDIG